MCRGTDTGAASGSKLIDDSADFFTSGVRGGDWVEITAAGAHARVLAVNMPDDSPPPRSWQEECRRWRSLRGVQARPQGSRTTPPLAWREGKPALLYRFQGGHTVDTYFVSPATKRSRAAGTDSCLGRSNQAIPAGIFDVDGAPAYGPASDAQDIYYRRALGRSRGSLQHVVNLAGVEYGALRSFAEVARSGDLLHAEG